MMTPTLKEKEGMIRWSSDPHGALSQTACERAAAATWSLRDGPEGDRGASGEWQASPRLRPPVAPGLCRQQG